MDWEELKKLAREQLLKSPRAQSYIIDYRRIPQNIIDFYGVGAIRPKQIIDFPGLNGNQIGSLNSLKDIEWVSAFIEGLDGSPLAIELRSIGTGDRDFYKIFLPLGQVHPPFFGLPQAIDLLHQESWVAVVEGIFEALSFASITKFPVLALLTKKYSTRQFRWLKRWCKKISLFLNADQMGQAAAHLWTNSRQWSGCQVVDSLWYECPDIILGKCEDLNDLLQQQGMVSLRHAIEYGLKR